MLPVALAVVALPVADEENPWSFATGAPTFPGVVAGRSSSLPPTFARVLSLPRAVCVVPGRRTGTPSADSTLAISSSETRSDSFAIIEKDIEDEADLFFFKIFSGPALVLVPVPALALLALADDALAPPSMFRLSIFLSYHQHAR